MANPPADLNPAVASVKMQDRGMGEKRNKMQERGKCAGAAAWTRLS